MALPLASPEYVSRKRLLPQRNLRNTHKGKERGTSARAGRSRRRKSVQDIMDAFELLRNTIPTYPPGARLSRIETLRVATSYIRDLKQILANARTTRISSTAGSQSLNSTASQSEIDLILIQDGAGETVVERNEVFTPYSIPTFDYQLTEFEKRSEHASFHHTTQTLSPACPSAAAGWTAANRTVSREVRGILLVSTRWP